jgi:D-sedoheptulose 7-phosphate isomerase
MTPSAEQIIADIIAAHKTALTAFEQSSIPIVTAMAETIAAAIKAGGTLYLCGNGGSAADAQHVAGEFIGRFQFERRALPAVALSTDTSVLTCVANDYDYDSVFARQAEALVRPGDVLWAFSTSGSSSNVLKAVDVARSKEAKIIAFTGKKESKLEARANLCLCADAAATARSQEIHQLAYHMICDLVERSFTD